MDTSIQRLEADNKALNDELQALADQNAKLLLDNAELKGRLGGLEDALPPREAL